MKAFLFLKSLHVITSRELHMAFCIRQHRRYRTVTTESPLWKYKAAYSSEITATRNEVVGAKIALLASLIQ